MVKEKIKHVFSQRISVLLLLSVFAFGLFLSCNKIVFRTVKCRDFEFHDELKWYAGNVGDVITLSNQKNETKEFIIRDKYLFHVTKYISDTGCGCHDGWGILLSTDIDSISMYSQSKYVENKPANRYDNFYIKYNDKISGFITKDKSIMSNYIVENKMFTQVMVFEYSYTENNEFKKIVIAPEIGVIELTETNGNVWINTDLEKKMSIDINTFEYSESTCE